VVPQRSDRGRQYGTAEIDRLLLLNQLVKRGHSIGSIASLPDSELRNLLENQPSPAQVEVESRPNVIAPILDAIEKFDALAAGDELSRLAVLLSPRDLVYHVSIPLMKEVGERWHAGTFAIAQEHMTSQMLRNLLGSLMRLYRSPNPAARIVIATPPGETHEFGILAAAMLAAMAGVEPIYLGADLPAQEIGEAARRVNARAVLLGVTVLNEATHSEIRRLADAMPESSQLWVGGLRGADVEVSGATRKIVYLKDLPAFEQECQLLQE